VVIGGGCLVTRGRRKKEKSMKPKYFLLWGKSVTYLCLPPIKKDPPLLNNTTNPTHMAHQNNALDVGKNIGQAKKVLGMITIFNSKSGAYLFIMGWL